MNHSNYTRPNDPGHVDTAEDWLMAALLFTQALGTTIPDGEGVIIKAKGEVSGFFGPKDDFIIIANIDDQIQALPLSDYVQDQSEFEEGMWITVSSDENNTTETNEQ